MPKIPTTADVAQELLDWLVDTRTRKPGALFRVNDVYQFVAESGRTSEQVAGALERMKAQGWIKENSGEFELTEAGFKQAA